MTPKGSTASLLVLLSLGALSTFELAEAITFSFGDDYNYSAPDPSSLKWESVVQQQHSDGSRHELWVENPYLYSENQSCQPGLDFDSTRAGCGMDATMNSIATLPYTASSGQRMVLNERYSPSKRVAALCWIWYPGDPLLNHSDPPDDYSMHWVGLRDSTHTSTGFVYIIVEHACIGGTNWKYGMKAYYTGTDGVSHYEAWTDYVVEENQWLDLTVEIGNDGSDVRLTAKNTSTGLSYFKSISTNLGSATASVEIAVQYRHNEYSRTDFVDAKISDPDFGISANSPLNICPGTANGSTVTVTSVGGFSGTVSLSSSMDHTSTYVSQYFAINPLSLSSGGSAVTSLLFSAQDNSNAQGTYVVVVTGTSGSIVHNAAVTVSVSYNYCVGGGGNGSVSYGTLITKDDGSKIPVQNIFPGTQVIIYDVPSNHETVATVTLVETVVTESLLTIHTSDGLPFRADANPRMVLWVLGTDGPVRKPITLIQPGDQIYNFDIGRWVSVTKVTVSFGGQHLMYDLATDQTVLGEYIANGYPDCSARGCKEGPN